MYVDGAQVGLLKFVSNPIAGGDTILSDLFVVPCSAGVHKVDIYWVVAGTGTTSGYGYYRNLTVREL